MAFTQTFERSFQVRFDVVDCVVFPPVRILSEQRLLLPGPVSLFQRSLDEADERAGGKDSC